MSPKARLVLALGLTIIVEPVVQSSLPAVPSSILALFLIIAGEITIGLLIGTMAKVIFSSIHVAGTITSFQMGLSAATLFDPSQKEQGALVGVFLSMLAILLIFATNMHHLFLQGLVESYDVFAPGKEIPFGGFADLLSKTLSSSFLMGVKIAAPQIVIGLVLYLGAGVMSRLMPQMQVFFIMMPVQIGIGFFVLMITLSACMMWFLDYYGDVMSEFIK